MADETVKKLLIKLGISTAEWKTAVNDIRSQLDSINAKAKQDAAQQKQAIKEQIDLTKQQIADQQNLAAQAKAMAAVDQAKAAWQRGQAEAMRTAKAAQELQTAESKKQEVIAQGALKTEQMKIVLQREQLRLIQQQTQAQERQAKIASRGNANSNEGGGIFGFLGQSVKTLTGGGLLGTIAGGAFAGGLGTEVFTGLIEKSHELVKAIIEDTGAAAQMRQEFEKLSQMKGNAPDAMLNNLRKATRGLVSDLDLYKVANGFMRSGIKASNEDFIKLIGSTVELGRSMNKSPVMSTQALTRAFLRNRMTALAQITGINALQLTLRGLPNTIDPATRATLQFQHALKVITEAQQKYGTVMTTVPELFEQVRNAEKNFIEGIAQGVLGTSNFNETIAALSQKLIDLGPRLEEIAHTVGKDLGSAIEFVTNHLHEIKIAAEAVIGINFAGKLAQWTLAAKELAAGLGLLKTAQEGAALAGGVKTAITSATAGAGSVVGTGVAAGAGEAAEGLSLATAGSIAAAVAAGALGILGVKWIIDWLKSHPEKTSGVGAGTRDLIGDAYQYDYSSRIKKAINSVSSVGKAIGNFYPNLVQGGSQVISDTVGGFMYGKQAAYPTVPQAGGLALPAGALEHTPGYVPPKTPEENQADQDNIALQQKLKQQRLQIDQEENKLLLDQSKQRIQQQEQLEKQNYDESLESLAEYVTKAKALKQQEYDAEVAQIEADRAAKIKNVKEKSSVNIDGKDYDVSQAQDKANLITLINKKSDDQLVQAKTRLNSELHALDMQQTNDALATATTYADAAAKIAKEGVQDRMAILEKEFQVGLTNAEDYLARKKSLIQEESQATIDGLNERGKAAKDNLAELAKLNVAYVENERATAKQIQELELSADSVRFKYNQQQYQQQVKPLQANYQTAQKLGNQPGLERSSLEGQQQATLDYIKVLSKETLTATDPNTKAQINEAIAQATQEMARLTAELAKINSSQVLAGVAGSVSGLAGSIPRSKTAGAISQLFGGIQQSQENVSKFQTGMTESDNSSNGGVFTDLATSFKQIIKGGDTLSASFESFGKNLGIVISGIQGAIQGLTSGKSGAGGALGGASALGGLGSSIGSAIPGLGPLGGLIGGAGGAVLGGVVGGIFGSKEKQLQQEIHKITDQFQSIVSDLNSGTISLSSALEQLRQERQQAIAMLSNNPKSGKGGGKGGKKGFDPTQAQAVIQQIDQQIQQLVNEQQTILQSLNTSLMELSNPIQYQDYLQSLDQIIQKYQEFASAAQGNAQEMTNANEYLNDSLQQYVTTLNQQLNQAQQTAIQDALTLINLEYQRQQIINQEAQSEYDVLTQGVLTRQRTSAMTKGQEIGQLRYQRDMQLEQINEQISLQQYKVQTETQIFNLATTRIGLENQLLAAQESAADYQINQISALALIISQLNSGLASGNFTQAIQNLESGGALPTESGIMQLLLQLLGLSGNVPSGAGGGITQNWLGTIPGDYYSAAQFMESEDPNFASLFQSAMGTAPGSSQRQQVEQDIQTYINQNDDQSQGGDGGDLMGFQQWVDSAQTLAKGGDFPGTGPILVGEEGPELILPKSGGTVLSNPIVAGLNALLGISGGSSSSSAATSSAKMSTESSLLSMTQKRTSLEMTVITARQSQLAMEFQYLQMLQDTYSTIAQHQSQSPAMGLEDMLAKTYELRGRYGSGNFRRETP